MPTRSQNGTTVNKFSGINAENDLIIHPSRFAVFKGGLRADTSHLGSTGNNSYHKSSRWSNGISGDYGWDVSILKVVYEAMRNSGSVFDNVASLVFEANIDKMGIPDFSQYMKSDRNGEYESATMRRLMLMGMMKGNNRMIVSDKEEEFDRNTINFGGLDRIMEKFFVLCGAPDGIPATVFLGQSPSGLNATGEADRAIWHEKVASIQENDIEPVMRNIDAALCMHVSGSTDGVVFEWNPLSEMTEKEKAEIQEINAKTIAQFSAASLMPLESVYQWLVNQGYMENTSLESFDDYRQAIAENQPTVSEADLV